MRKLVLMLMLVSNLFACAKEIRQPFLLASSLLTSTGDNWPLGANISSSRFTVLEFFSANCPVQKSHDQRLVQLHERYRSRGVRIVIVDSESAGSPERDAEGAKNRGYPFPILIDKEGRVANLLHAEYATFTVVVDRYGKTHYAGGIDSDHSRLSSQGVPYLKNALDDLLAGNEPRQTTTKTLGCTLQKW